MLTTGSKWRKWSLFVTTLATAAFLLQGCGGGDDGAAGPAGAAGATGATGPAGATGTPGKDLAAGTVDAQQLTVEDLLNRPFAVSITSADASGVQPKVSFKVTMKDSGQGVRGLRTITLQMAQLEPAVDGSASYWNNYIADGLPQASIPAFMVRGATVTSAPIDPSADAVDIFNADGTVKAKGYTIVDNGDGSYVATFGAKIKDNTKVVFDANKTQRIAVHVRSVAVPGNYRNPITGALASSTGGVTPTAVTAGAYPGPANFKTGAIVSGFNTSGGADIYDFVPATGAKVTGARDIVTTAACNGCHYKIESGWPTGNNTSGHFGGRPDVRMCVMCHTPQNTAGKGDMTPFIHQIHAGEDLPVAATGLPAALDVSEIAFPQDLRNCGTCHKGTVANSWQNPSRKACGSCHNNVDFTTGANHGLGGIRTDDKLCSACHDGIYIATVHTPVAAFKNTTSGLSGTQQTTYYAHNDNLPTDAYKIEWDLQSVTVDAARKVAVKFGIKKNGTLVDFGTYDATTHKNIIDNTIGGPSIRIDYNVSQDGYVPADFNASISVPALGMAAPTVSSSTATPASTYTPAVTTSNIWASGGTLTANGITWTLTRGTDGYYTASSSLALPASTTMVSALMYGTITQTNLTAYPFKEDSIADFAAYANSATETRYAAKQSGLVLTPDNVLKKVTSTGFTARRAVVDNAKCKACHDSLGLFTKKAFHGGGRNDGADCHMCHLPNSVNTGWSYNANTFVHAIHGASKRGTNYTFTATAANPKGFGGIGYPGLLKNCEQCHLSGTYDFSATASAAAVDKLLYNTVGTGTTAAATFNTAPYIAQTAGTVYGSGFSAATTTGAVVTTEPAATTLASSPISAACFSCHDSAAARSHMEINGGSIYAARTAALAKKETCLVCHGAASATNGYANADTPAIKAVHRWW